MSKRTDTQSITSLPQSPDQERRSRVLKYTIAMTIRTLCVVSLLFVQGWWMAVAIVGAIVLPYFAVVIANVHSKPEQAAPVLRPGAIIPLPPTSIGDERTERPQAS
ncbi:DUF3099 domain-containing protein [Naasia aerilata]|uniref:DUF3099 domain-containing protein n=1 Tax=Naasia aerilata TaxID=1162966 RepID=A0ABM8GFB7_9MICO|nr:DUF3099 domain-containing protein [Naasia aerilata]BDZ47054.1 hypothetical protein GCM10025866_29630 [Naasia aerilata]